MRTSFDVALIYLPPTWSALGLTAIHVNRVLRQLRERDLLTLKKGTVTR
jgi:CRP-like cAMP-binding protein